MQSQARDEYLATQVLTATPEKLQLMVVEAALRASVRAEEFLVAGKTAEATASLLNAQRIMARLIGDLDYLRQPALAGQIALVYGFVYKSLVLAQLRRDAARAADAVRVLRVERETWRLACEKVGARGSDNASAAGPAPPHYLNYAESADADAPHSPVSFEA